MKYYTKLNQYKASNLVYDVDKEVAHSYEWYEIAKRINGVMVVNNYYYSNTTCRHSYKIMQLLDNLGRQYITIEAPKGLQSLNAAKEYYHTKIKDIQEKINKPRSRKSTNYDRLNMIKELTEKLMVINGLEG